jgi:hypothetical protein
VKHLQIRHDVRNLHPITSAADHVDIQGDRYPARDPGTRHNTEGEAHVMNPNAEHEIVSLSKQKWDWMSAQDVAPLDVLISEAAVFVHMGARRSVRKKSSTSSL